MLPSSLISGPASPGKQGGRHAAAGGGGEWRPRVPGMLDGGGQRCEGSRRAERCGKAKGKASPGEVKEGCYSQLPPTHSLPTVNPKCLTREL